MTSNAKKDPDDTTDITTATGGAAGTEVVTTDGKTTISDVVVEKIAGLAAREVRGVHALGSGTARAIGAVRSRIPVGNAGLGTGVNVEVGERQAAVDLDLVVEYGVELADLAREVRRNVIENIEQMTSLEVTEVNLHIRDVFLPGDDEPEESRVQ